MATIIEIDNDRSMELSLIMDMDQIVPKIVKRVLEVVQQKVDEIVYDPYSSYDLTYDRQYDEGGLYGSWVSVDYLNADESVKEGLTPREDNTVAYIIHSDWESMSHDPENFIHGSDAWDVTDDIREHLVEMVINGASGGTGWHVGDIFGEGFWRERRDFWTPIIDYLKINFDVIVHDELSDFYGGENIF